MPIEVKWDEENKTIIRTNFIGKWMWDDYDTAVDQVIELANRVKDRVDMISDLREADPFPPGDASPHVMRFRSNVPDNFGILVVISSDVFTRKVVETANKNTRSRNKSIITTNLDDAKRLIAIARQANRIGN